MKNSYTQLIIAVVVIILLGAGVYYFTTQQPEQLVEEEDLQVNIQIRELVYLENFRGEVSVVADQFKSTRDIDIYDTIRLPFSEQDFNDTTYLVSINEVNQENLEIFFSNPVIYEENEVTSLVLTKDSTVQIFSPTEDQGFTWELTLVE